MAALFDTVGLPTGVHPISLRATSQYAQSRVSSVIPHRLLQVNEQDSPFGAGWTLVGLERLYPQDDQSVLAVEGRGSAGRFALSTPQSYAALVLDDAPLAYFRLGETQGTAGTCLAARDEVSTGSVTAVGQSATDWRCGVPGAIVNDEDRAVYLAGTGSDLNSRHLQVQNLSQANALRFTGASAFTLEIWTRFTKHERATHLLSAWAADNEGQSQYFLAIATDGTPVCRVVRNSGPSTVAGTTTLADNAWHHLVCRYDGTGTVGDGLELFVDGVRVANAPGLTGTVNSSGTQAARLRCSGSFGEKGCGIDNSGSGGCGMPPTCCPNSGFAECESAKLIDEAAWYGQALSDTQILAHHEAGALGVFPAPPAYSSPAGDFSTLQEHPDGTFTRTWPNGTRHEFDAAGRQTAVADRSGNTTTYTYDGNDRIIAITDPIGQVTELDYSGDHLHTVTDPANRLTTFEHDPAGNLLRIIFPDASTKSFGYDGRHLMTSETDGRLNTTMREYNFAGRVVSATLPDGSQRSATAAELVGLVDPATGMGTEGNPGPVHEPSEAVSTYTDGEGREWTMEHGLLARATKMTDSAG